HQQQNQQYGQSSSKRSCWRRLSMQCSSGRGQHQARLRAIDCRKSGVAPVPALPRERPLLLPSPLDRRLAKEQRLSRCLVLFKHNLGRIL
uniref:Ovule protein n=1 Tax=Macrostomum lignano TaxID=282301 RepID=A0A1I8IX39_9PLAT